MYLYNFSYCSHTQHSVLVAHSLMIVMTCSQARLSCQGQLNDYKLIAAASGAVALAANPFEGDGVAVNTEAGKVQSDYLCSCSLLWLLTSVVGHYCWLLIARGCSLLLLTTAHYCGCSLRLLTVVAHYGCSLLFTIDTSDLLLQITNCCLSSNNILSIWLNGSGGCSGVCFA